MIPRKNFRPSSGSKNQTFIPPDSDYNKKGSVPPRLTNNPPITQNNNNPSNNNNNNNNVVPTGSAKKKIKTEEEAPKVFTEDDLIKDKLREINEPIIYYGEGPEERKRRMILQYQKRSLSTDFLLRPLLQTEAVTSGGAPQAQPVFDAVTETEETFYTVGSDALLEARTWIAQFSLPRAHARLITEAKRREVMIERKADQTEATKPSNSADNNNSTNNNNTNNSNTNDSNMTKSSTSSKSETSKSSRGSRAPLEIMSEEYEVKSKKALQRAAGFLKEMVNVTSEIGDERALSSCQLSYDASHLAVASWSGLAKIWRLSDSTEVHQLRGHTDRVTCVRYHPKSHTNPSPHVVHLATSGLDATVKLWALGSSLPIATLSGHEARVNRVAWHPSGRFIASTSYDTTWRLWDLEKCVCLLEQDGALKSLYAVAFQGDGSLVATGGADAVGRVWDLRTGRSVMSLQGHSRQIVALDWSPNGYCVASGSEDNAVREWDLRKRAEVHSFPAHLSVVSSVKYDPAGDLLMSAAFDGACKFWSTQYGALVATVDTPPDAKIMGADFANDLRTLVTVNYDRTWKLFKPDMSSFTKMEVVNEN